MYQIYFDDFLIYDPRLDGYDVFEPTVHLAVGEPGNMSFTLTSDHPNISQITKMHGILKLIEDGATIYRGRVTMDSRDFGLSRSYESEGMLACLNDSVIPPFKFPDDFLTDEGYIAAAESGNVVQFLLGWILSQHNDQVTQEQRINIGTVTVADNNNYISRSSSDYCSAWETINDKLVNSSVGGYLLQRYEDDGVYLDYVAELPLTNAQEVIFGDNLLDLVSEVNASDAYSVILPVGADGLTIESMPDGDISSDLAKSGRTIYSRSAVAMYGKITRVEKWDDVTEAGNLQTKAAEKLSDAGLAHTITVSAADLHGIDASTPSFRVGRFVRLTSKPHDFSALYPLVELDPDILNPGGTELTLGRTATSQTDINKATKAATEEMIDRQQFEIKKNAEDLQTVTQTTSEQITSVLQTCESLILQAAENYVKTGDLETYKQTVNSQFVQTANQIQFQFSTVTEQVNNVESDVQVKYNQITEYIRFVGAMMELGRLGNDFTAELSNEKLSFEQNGVEIAYISNNKLYITDAEVSEHLAMGKADRGYYDLYVRSNKHITLKRRR